MRWLHRARRHDRNLAALRRAARGALVMPLALYLGLEVVGDEYLGLFAVFGSFAVLLLADFTGPMPQRLQAQAALGAAGVGLVCLGTLTSAHPWLAALGMLAVGLPILFAGVVSSVLASATPALLLAYVLPACLPASASAIPERIAGWGLAAVLGLLAVGLLWPTPTTDPLREPVARCLRLMAAGLRAEVAFAAGGPGAPSLAQRDRAVAASDAAAEQLRTTYLAAPYRPTTLDTVDRTVVRLADEVEWLAQVVQHGRPAATVAHHVARRPARSCSPPPTCCTWPPGCCTTPGPAAATSRPGSRCCAPPPRPSTTTSRAPWWPGAATAAPATTPTPSRSPRSTRRSAPTSSRSAPAGSRRTSC